MAIGIELRRPWPRRRTALLKFHFVGFFNTHRAFHPIVIFEKERQLRGLNAIAAAAMQQKLPIAPLKAIGECFG
jgi:hypothetical protein